MFLVQSEWPQESKWDTALRDSFEELVDGEVADVTVEMNGSNHDDLLSALDAPICEVVRSLLCIKLRHYEPDTPGWPRDVRHAL